MDSVLGTVGIFFKRILVVEMVGVLVKLVWKNMNGKKWKEMCRGFVIIGGGKDVENFYDLYFNVNIILFVFIGR